MSDRDKAIATIKGAFEHDPGDDLTSTVAGQLAAGATMRSMRGKVAGRDSVAAALAGSDFRRFFSGGAWDAPEEKDGAVVLTSRQPEKMPTGGGRLTVEFNGNGEVNHVELWSLPAPFLKPESLELTPAIKEAVNESMVA